MSYINRKTISISLFAAAICVLLPVFLLLNRFRMRDELSKLDDSKNYLIDFSSLLDKGWVIGKPYREKPEDMTGYSDTILGHSSIQAYNPANSSAQIKLHVIAYMNPEQAQIQYADQDDWIFTYDFGVPPSRQISKYQDLPSEIKLKAEKYHIACKTENLNRRCSSLFLYGKYVAFIEAYMEIAGVNYINEDVLLKVYKALDEKMVNTQGVPSA